MNSRTTCKSYKNSIRNLIRGLAFGLVLTIPFSLHSKVTIVDPVDLFPTSSQQRATELITYFIRRFHYHRDIRLDDELSGQILDQYLEVLDGNRSYLIASDIEKIQAHRYRLDDAIRRADLSLAFDIFKLVRIRVEQRVGYAMDLLRRGFDFSIDEEVLVDRSEAAWAQDKSDLDEIWRKRVKNDWLNNKLSGKSDEEIVELLQRRYTQIETRISQLDREDIFQTFINAYISTIEPHTTYLARRASDNFNINMSLRLEGIGAALQTEDEYTVVRRVIPGAPADLSKQLFVGDRILGVGQGDDQRIEDIVGWRLADVVDLIRGRKGSVVRLEILPASEPSGGITRTIRLIRDEVKLSGRAAKKEIIEVPSEHGMNRIAVIRVPTFYSSFESKQQNAENFRSTTQDVRKILRDLRAESISGVVIDLLGNSGGSLPEAIELTGLFIHSGPIVQVRDSRGRVSINKDPDPDIVYSGPLAVLVDRFSASASEIFAGAIQDYRRGLIIGEPTYGKGTVQRVEPLGNNSEMGKLKYTIAQFFRVNGESTQLRGVVPDITFPTSINSDDQGERAFDNALPWASVQPARYDLSNLDTSTIPILEEKHKRRIDTDPGFDYLRSEIEAINNIRDQKSFSLLESKRRELRDETDQNRLSTLNVYRKAVGKNLLENFDQLDQERNQADPTDLSDSYKIQRSEAAHILSDLIYLQRQQLMTQRTLDSLQ